MPASPHTELGEESALADVTSGLMWLAAGAVGLAGMALPGSDRSHPVWVGVLFAFAMVWGVASLVLARRKPLDIGVRAAITAAMMPLVGVALWATGGASSQVQPLLIFTVLFVAYFMPPRLAWPLVALFCAAYASPLLYDARATAEGYPARVLGFVVAVAGVTRVMQVLKHRLQSAEAQQRTRAEQDPLTGLHNRRSFDAALERATQSGPDARVALVLFDFDGFKAINDAHGHPVGDAVLCAIAGACGGVVREGDCLARLGGDEFGVVAADAGPGAAERIAGALADAIADAPTPAEVGAVTATFGWAVAPGDDADPATLVRRADQRLLARKRARVHA
jgi:diguanylate cyclase (GGDEF)-like protein